MEVIDAPSKVASTEVEKSLARLASMGTGASGFHGRQHAPCEKVAVLVYGGGYSTLADLLKG